MSVMDYKHDPYHNCEKYGTNCCIGKKDMRVVWRIRQQNNKVMASSTSAKWSVFLIIPIFINKYVYYEEIKDVCLL